MSNKGWASLFVGPHVIKSSLPVAFLTWWNLPGSPLSIFHSRTWGEPGNEASSKYALINGFLWYLYFYRSQIATLEDLLGPGDLKYMKLKNRLSNCTNANGDFIATKAEVIAWFPGFSPAFSDAVLLCPMLGAWLYTWMCMESSLVHPLHCWVMSTLETVHI